MESIQYGTQTIHFHLKRADRKTLGIEVHPDLSVHVIAPLKAKKGTINEKIIKRSQWITKQRKFFEQFLPRTPERQYVSGETHLYLGRRYVLRIRKGTSDNVKLKGGELIVNYTKQNNTDHIKHLLTSWYYNHARRIFDQKQNEIIKLFSTFKINHPDFEIRRMKNRWGSCTKSGKIILNPELIKAPSRCIDYVIIHELCHLVHPNHGKEFYKLQELLNPNWEKWKMKLEAFMK